ncbi:MAG: hypothetical protein KF841_14155 [Phycisphaerae bacterium]|nr:hypothetical protein [Phycisphaerae bacterium]
MKLDFLSEPPPLEFGEGDDKFSLIMKRPTSADRSAVLDAVNDKSLQSMQYQLERMVKGWKGVEDKNGTAIDFYEDENETKSRLGNFLGALPLVAQFEVCAGLVAFIGIPPKGVEDIIDNLKKAGCEGSLGVKTDPTASSGKRGKTGASASSSDSAT